MIRTAHHRAADQAVASVFEANVAAELRACGLQVETFFSSRTMPDLFILDLKIYLELKMKVQPLSKRWHAHAPGAPEDTIVIDEVSVRRLVQFHGDVWFLLYDVPLQRLFVASLAELVSVERGRLDRSGRAKLLYDMHHFHKVSSATEAVEYIDRQKDHDLYRQVAPVGRKEIAKVN